MTATGSFEVWQFPPRAGGADLKVGNDALHKSVEGSLNPLSYSIAGKDGGLSVCFGDRFAGSSAAERAGLEKDAGGACTGEFGACEEKTGAHTLKGTSKSAQKQGQKHACVCVCKYASTMYAAFPVGLPVHFVFVRKDKRRLRREFFVSGSGGLVGKMSCVYRLIISCCRSKTDE